MEAAIWTLIVILATALFGMFFYLGARIDQLGTKMDGRIDQLGARLDQMGARLDGRIDQLGQRIDGLTEQVAKLAEQAHSHS